MGGGAPNVVAESLHAGCVPVVTKIDAWRDCVADSQIGASVEIDDVTGLSEALVRVCTSDNLQEQSEFARAYADDCFNMEKNVDHIYIRLNSNITK